MEASSANVVEEVRQPVDRAAKRRLSWRRWSPLRAIASLRITVACLVAMTVLVFIGTLAQVDRGIWLVQREYFESFFVWKPVAGVTLPIFPGGYLIGGVFLLNLLAATFSRFNLRWGKAGILMIHLGIIVILLGELGTDLAANEMQMVIDEGQTVNYTEDLWNTELALTTTLPDGTRRLVSIPSAQLVAGNTIEHDALPARVVVEQYMDNATPVRALTMDANPADRGMGLEIGMLPRPPETDPQRRDAPAAYVTVDGAGTFMLASALRATQALELDGSTWEIALRPKRRYYPFSVTLIDFIHERHPGTSIPSHFESRVRLVDPTNDQDRETDIYMNHPLRYAGLTFYQASFANDDRTTVLQVVRNPAWLLPYISCILVGVGLTTQFSIGLGRFLRKRKMGVA